MHTPRTKFQVSFLVLIGLGAATYHVCVRKVTPRVPLMRAVHGGKLDGIPNKENRLARY
jgi:hypothetical protein